MTCSLALLTPPLLAGGKVFSTSAGDADIELPDQRALIHYADGVETLVLETTFLAEEDGEFAWLVPVPSVPEVRPSTPGLFSTLHVLSAPRLVYDVGYWFLLSAVVFAVASCWILRYYKVVGLMLVALLVFVFAKHSLIAEFSGGSLETEPLPVEVPESQALAAYDVSVLSASDAGEVLGWLRERGFSVSPGVEPVVARYLREGWKFVAARLERPGAEATGPLGSRPLAFTFPTEKAVYPLRLTGTGGEPCSVELYVFGPRRATIAGFESVLCQRPGYPGGVGDGGPSPGEAGSSDGSGAALPVLHPELSKVVRGARVATKLTARLGPEDMQNDAYVEWRDYQPSWPTRYSSWGAYMLAANVALNLLFVSFLVLLAVTRGKRLEGRRAQWWVGGVVVACSLAGAVVWSSLPKADVPDAHEFEPYVLHRQVADFLRAGVRRSTLDLARVGGFIERMFAGDVGPQANPYTGRSIRYEDSPGNYTLRATRQEIVYTWYDRAGAAHPERITR